MRLATHAGLSGWRTLPFVTARSIPVPSNIRGHKTDPRAVHPTGSDPMARPTYGGIAFLIRDAGVHGNHWSDPSEPLGILSIGTPDSKVKEFISSGVRSPWFGPFQVGRR